LTVEGLQQTLDDKKYASEENKSRRGTRDVMDKANRLTARNKATFAGTQAKGGIYEPEGLADKASRAGLRNTITSADAADITLAVAKGTKGAKIKGINADADFKQSKANVQTKTEAEQIEATKIALKTAEEQYRRLEAQVGESKIFETKDYGPLTLAELGSLYSKEMEARGSTFSIAKTTDFDTWLRTKLKDPGPEKPGIPDPTGKGGPRTNLADFEAKPAASTSNINIAP